MGREVKRVPLDFDLGKNEVWPGYLMPEDLQGIPCEPCGATGYSVRARELMNLWYGNALFQPEDNGSTPFPGGHPAVRARAERNIANAPEYYGPGEGAINREERRLRELFNSRWMHHLNADDVKALLDADRLRDLTHTCRKGEGWKRIDPPVTPTPEQVNTWSLAGLGHDSSNCHIVVQARCEREGGTDTCDTCGGHSITWRDDAHKAAYDAWKSTEPPTGDGWQLWETVTEGSPISPVFPDVEGLIAWMQTPAAKWGAMGPWDEATARSFVEGPGWAPTLVETSAGVTDGVTAVTA